MPKYRPDELESFQQAYLAGRKKVEAGALEDAIACFDRVLGKLPRRHRRRAYRIADTRARRACSAFELPVVFRDALLAKAYCLNELGRFDDAFAVLQRALELDPNNPRVYAEIGFTHGALEDMEHARTAYLHAVELEPHNPEHLRALAHFALLIDDFTSAHDYAARALGLDPNFAPCLQQMGYVEYRLGRLEEAITVLEYANGLTPGDREIILPLAGMLRECDRARAAIDLLTPYLDANPEDEEALGVMTEALQQDAFGDEVIPHALRVLARHPNDLSALDLLGWGYYRQGRLQEARAVVRRLITIDPLQAHHQFKLGLIDQALGTFPQAMAAFMRVLNLEIAPDLRQMAQDAISTLDRAQIEHLLAHLRMDPEFHDYLLQAPDTALHQAGYLLSPIGLQMLLALDLNDEGAGLPVPPSPTIN